MRLLTYTVQENDQGRPVRTLVPSRFALGRHAFRRLKVLGAIHVNGRPVHADYILHAGDFIELHIPSDSDHSSAPDTPTFSPDDTLPPSFIRYQDDDLWIVSKGAPLPTLPAAHIHSATLREQLIQMLHVNPTTFSYHPVNRLDKGTSGLLCIARHAHAQRLLTQQLHTGRFIREYLAITDGIPAQKEGTISAPIARIGTGATRAVREDGQHAVTHYRVLRTTAHHALLRLRLETGRTHQIRVHLAHIGCPITGDYLYGTVSDLLPGRFALHSAFLRITQPITGQNISLDEPLPPELEFLLSSDSE